MPGLARRCWTLWLGRCRMPLLDLCKLTAGCPAPGPGTAAQLGRYLGEYSPVPDPDPDPDPDADAAAGDPCAVNRAHVEAFQGWMIDTRSASTALNKHKGLQQFFRWLQTDEQAIRVSPMLRVRQPKTPT